MEYIKTIKLLNIVLEQLSESTLYFAKKTIGLVQIWSLSILKTAHGIFVSKYMLPSPNHIQRSNLGHSDCNCCNFDICPPTYGYSHFVSEKKNTMCLQNSTYMLAFFLLLPIYSAFEEQCSMYSTARPSSWHKPKWVQKNVLNQLRSRLRRSN